ncbi:MAG: biotin/lipoyl-binding protein [Gemmatimonadales bacterium]
MATDIAMDLPATAEPEARSWTRRLPLILGALLVVALAGWGVRRYVYSRNHVTTDNAQVDGHITAIAPRIAGFIDRVPVEENQRVKAGDTLVVLDRRDLLVRLEQVEAELRTAQAAGGTDRRAGQATAQLQATRAEAASAEADIAAAEAGFRQAGADYERYRGLAASKIIPAQQLDAAAAALRPRAARCRPRGRRSGAPMRALRRRRPPSRTPGSSWATPSSSRPTTASWPGGARNRARWCRSARISCRSCRTRTSGSPPT